jgi:hypothetical protein
MNQSLEIAGRVMNMAKTKDKNDPKQKQHSARAVFKPKDNNQDYREMIRFLIEDYRAGTLKLNDDKDIREKLDALKDGDDWDTLAPDVKALALINLLKHKVPED